MEEEQLAPIFAKETYNMLGKGSKEKRSDKINKNIAKTGYTAIKDKSNRDILYLQNDKDKTVHISHRGTDFSKPRDVSADLSFALGNEHHNKEFKKRRDKTSNLVKNIPDDYKLNLSGHSYGGASMNDTLLNKKNVRDKVESANGYNGAFSPFTKKVSKKIKSELDNRVTHHRISNDIISASSSIHLPFGKVKTYKQKQNDKIMPQSINPIFKTIDSYKAHSIDNFIS